MQTALATVKNPETLHNEKTRILKVTQVSFKYCAPFAKCITKIDVTKIDDAENLDLVMPMSNLTEYSSNCSETTGKL